MKQKILLVEDEHSIADSISYNLKQEGFSVTHVDEGPIALELFQEEEFSLIILDLMLPEISGLDICRSIRKTSDIPIIMVTAKDSEADRVAGLEIGADDYVIKPFSVRELLSRVRAVLRRTDMSKNEKSSQVIKVGNIEIDIGKYEAKVNDKQINLRPREFELLYALCENKGNLMSREQIFDEIWGYTFIGNSKTLDVHIQRIREKIEKNPKDPKKLITVRGVGYKLVEDE
ncbi:MAG: response regulator [Candidatus Actinomarina sp.]|jgi:DNA-binding response OmpR family regulator|tara:strand:- start:3045 stop:3737 length:693 start_codon:yes stop_codon:yes gene_type:complete